MTDVEVKVFHLEPHIVKASSAAEIIVPINTGES